MECCPTSSFQLHLLIVCLFLPFGFPFLSIWSPRFPRVSIATRVTATTTTTTTVTARQHHLEPASASITYKKHAEDFVVIEDRCLYAFLGLEDVLKEDLDQPPPPPSSSLEALETLHKMLASEQIKELQNLQNSDSSSLSLTIPSWTKEQRSLFHTSIRIAFSGQFDSKYKPDNEEMFITSTSSSSKQRQRLQLNQRWDRSKSNYIHFTAIKSSMTTTELIQKLAKSTGLLSNRFEFCGTKDKKAVTAQRISVWRIDPQVAQEKLLEYYGYNNNSSSQSLIHLCDFDMNPQHDEPMKLGDISGNFFALKLRCTSDDNDKNHQLANKMMEIINTHGDENFVNIFGKQRFGFPLQINPEIGKFLLQGQYRKAIVLILLSPTREEVDVFRIFIHHIMKIVQDRENNDDKYNNYTNIQYFQNVYKRYSSQVSGYKESEVIRNNNFVLESIELTLAIMNDPSSVCANFTQLKIPRGMSPLKKQILVEMSKQFKGVNQDFDKIDFGKLFHKLQKANQQLFVNSYQSKLWNDAALERYNCIMSPRKVQSNDLVLVDQEGNPITAWEAAESSIIMNGNFISSYINKGNGNVIKNYNRTERYYYKKLIDKEDISKYPIESVILPLPGYETSVDCLPIKMKTQIDEDEMNILLSKQQKNAVFRVPGAYRHLLSKPTNVRYRCCDGNKDVGNGNIKGKNEGWHLPSRIDDYSGNQEYKLPINVEHFMHLGDDQLNDIVHRVSSRQTDRNDNNHKDDGDDKGGDDFDDESESYIQICFSLCSSTYATTYIESLLDRLDALLTTST